MAVRVRISPPLQRLTDRKDKVSVTSGTIISLINEGGTSFLISPS